MNLYTFARYLDYASSIFVLLPILFLVKRKANFKHLILVVLGGVLVLGGLTDVANNIIYNVYGHPNISIANIEFIIEFFFIGYLFILAYPKMKKLIRIVSPVFFVLFIMTSLFWQPISSYQSITRITAAIIFITYSIMYFVYLIKELPAEVITHYSPFWIVVGIFFYFTLTLYLFALSNYVFVNLPTREGMVFWMSRCVSEIIKDILFTVGIYYGTKEKY